MNSRLGMRRNAAIIFDFDGTVTLGNGPVRAYAQAIQTELLADPAAFAKQVEAALADIDDLQSPYRDGYHAVADLAIAQGIDTAELSRAYLKSRQLLGTEKAPVEMPSQLPALLKAIAPHAWVVLATNAPAEGIEKLLDRWKVGEFFDQISFNTNKPAGLSSLIEELDSQRILAIGDIAENDLAPAAELGAHTLLVTPQHTLDDAFEDIITWARQGE
ncbi:HAD family hydrolase [Corynebacterium sp. J010B-136]|uniref:HAD family hydrolase n=1 Tax=Corynebacterium sp. J010B-136 TaxID=2099401 RepID=UPI000CF9FFE6|nr:HAD family hydrolase [Corynebacterium sp. J010B-136]PQM75125.1 HAD family hydrolase [Corynebacterium sp. J010B-136]